MELIAFNSMLDIDDPKVGGIYRVIATPPGDPRIFVARLPEFESGKRRRDASKGIVMRSLDRQTLDELLKLKRIRSVDLDTNEMALRDVESMSQSDRDIFKRRCHAMSDFFDHEKLWLVLIERGNLGSMVDTAIQRSGMARSEVHRLKCGIFLNGFTESSLIPHRYRCGAPGVARPCTDTKKKAGRKTTSERAGLTDLHPQQGMQAGWREKVLAAYQSIPNPKPLGDDLYAKIIRKVFVARYKSEVNGLVPIMPAQGTIPNERQVRWIIDSGVEKFDRALRRHSDFHASSSLRGLRGLAYEGVAGPGHVYAIDATVGDVYLRSSVDRNWIIGRPIVYFIVDVWSTAIVGFYVGLQGPSWNSAKIAIYMSTLDTAGFGETIGVDTAQCLSPTPTLPYEFLCDRGEFLSEAARECAKALKFSLGFTPSYRGDLKGPVEVVHRIAKDQQFRLIPGAIDARRREIELRTDLRDALLTVREYAQYLTWCVADRNFLSDRRHRLTTDMMAAGVPATPAGLWRFGHDVGIGYRKVVDQRELAVQLLPRAVATVTRSGIYFADLRYESDLLAERLWTQQARLDGAIRLDVHHLPSNLSTIWWPEAASGRMHRLTLSPHARARADTTLDEWLDAKAVALIQARDAEFARLQARLVRLERVDRLVHSAREKLADAQVHGSSTVPGLRVARAVEDRLGESATAMPTVAQQTSASMVVDFDAGYDEMMRYALGAAEKEAQSSDAS